MFSLELIQNTEQEEEYMSIVINVNINNTKISLYPEYPQMFVDSQFINNPHMDIKFNSGTTNGEFKIDLNDKFTINVAKYGDGKGGLMSFTTERTYDLSIQFSKIVKEISDLIKENPHLY